MGKNSCDVTVAIAGSPNVGKSTLFTVLTGEVAHVANWPGTTVALKRGARVHRGSRMCFVDLPGIYGLSASSSEEIVAREYIVGGDADVIVVLVDSTAPERTLYLPIQVMELNPRVVVALTKMDMAHTLGIHIHVDKLEARLGVPVVAVSALQGLGVRELLDAILRVARKGAGHPLRINYRGIEPFISEAERILDGSKILSRYPLRWSAIKLLEGDEHLEKLLEEAGETDKLERIRELREAIKRGTGREPVDLIVSSRFECVDRIVREVIVRVEERRGKRWLETVLEHPVLGVVTSFALLLAMFLSAFTINTGFPLNVLFRLVGWRGAAELIEANNLGTVLSSLFDWLSSYSEALLTSANAPQWLVSLVSGGIIPGIGSVVSFFPLILMVFMFLSVLEDSGVGPRIAVAFNNLFAHFGLTGRAIYPIMISFGCNVPGVMASRSAIEDEERIEIIYSVPFIPCQARLIVLLAFATAYFSSPLTQSLALLAVYGVATAVSLFTALLVRRILFRKAEPPELLLEIPPIHRPSGKVVWWLTWDYSKHFLKKAGTIIFALSVLTWFMMSYGPGGVASGPEGSWAAAIGRSLWPLALPLGVAGEDAWKIVYLLINGFVAKESVIESAALLAGTSNTPKAILSLGLSTAQALSFMMFTSLYVPCLATLAVMYQESRSVKHTLLALVYMMGVASVVSLATYLLASAIL